MKDVCRCDWRIGWRDCPYHRTGQFSYKVQRARCASIGGALVAHLSLLEKSVQAGECVSQGLIIKEDGKTFHI